ncbi:MAG: InlB B-repeat-containing protein, partial [Methanomassiliicoccaceae archaeon]|nr:InlB B-repeat-containing protein [Methanomassiliicoccaceae archaeon]
AALFLALLTSTALVYIEQTASSSEADLLEETLEVNTLHLNDLVAGDTYRPTGTIELPALEANQKGVIDGKRPGGNITISSLEFDGGLWGAPLFYIDGHNKGEYQFLNLTIETNYNAFAAIQIGNDDGDKEGSVSIENVRFIGSPYDCSINSFCSELNIDSCYFEAGGGIWMHIFSYSGDVTVNDSYFYGGGIDIIVYDAGDKSVTVKNSYFECGGDAISYYSDAVDLLVSDCTFVGGYDTSVFVGMSGPGGEIKLERSLFTWKYDGGSYLSGQAVRVGRSETGPGEGRVTIDECSFFELAPSFNSQIVSLSDVTWFSISGTTFYGNQTGTGGYYDGEPILGVYPVSGGSGTIVNSTFWGNMVTNDSYPTACVLLDLDDSHVDLIHNTFFDNYYSDGTSSIPASIEILGGEANFINCILLCDDNSTGSTIWSDFGYISVRGCIDNPDVGGSAENVLMSAFAFDDGRSAGCKLDGFSPEVIVTIPIVPFGKAYHSEDAYTDDLPEKDQRGNPRGPEPDIGAVSILFTKFVAGSGGEAAWAVFTYYGPTPYSLEYPYWFFGYNWNEPPYYYYTYFESLAVSENGDGKIELPYYPYPEYMGEHKFLLGWSTDPAAEMPDPTLAYIDYEISGEFAAGETYYAVWNDYPFITFVPGKDFPPVTMLWEPEMSPPTYPVVGGMALTKWTYEVEGMTTVWDPSDGPYFLTVYGQWEPVSTAELTVEFRDGGKTTSVNVTYGNTVAKPADPEREGYIFMGWFTAATGGTKWDFSAKVTSNLVLFAQWDEVISLTVTFVPGNGGDPFTSEVMKGQTLSSPQSLTREGYNFKGWFTAASGGTKWDFGSPVMSSMTLYAQWEINGQGGGDDPTLTGGDVVLIAAGIVAASFATLGAAGLAGATGIGSQASIANVLQQGAYADSGADSSGEDKNRRSVIFDPRNGKNPWASSVMLGRQVDRPGNPKPPSGMMFSHWSTTPEGPPFDFMTPVNSVLHLYAVYVPAA